MSDESRVAGVIAGFSTFEGFLVEVRRRGYDVEDCRGNPNEQCAYRAIRMVRVSYGGFPHPIITLKWYEFPNSDVPRNYTLEAEGRWDIREGGIITRVFPFTPEDLLLQLDKIEKKLIDGLLSMKDIFDDEPAGSTG